MDNNQGRSGGGGTDKGCQATAKVYSYDAKPGMEHESTHFYLSYYTLSVNSQIKKCLSLYVIPCMYKTNLIYKV